MIGFSPTAAAVLVVILVRREDRPGSWWGANGWRAIARTADFTPKGPRAMGDPKEVIEQIASQADVTADQTMPPGAVFTRPNKPVPSVTGGSPRGSRRHRAPSRPSGRAPVQPHPRMDPLRTQRVQGRDRAEHDREDLRRRAAIRQLVA